MKHLIKIKDLSNDEINEIFLRAYEFETNRRKANHINAHVINMFEENSTRTKLSFEVAINKINAKKYDFSFETSSINKGETLYDTINNLSAIGINAVVFRNQDNTLIKRLSERKYYNDIAFINAGSGVSAHPTQALLDFYTLKRHFLNLENKTIVITGDIKHSRVAKSDIELFKRFNMNIRCLAPKEFYDKRIEGVEYFSDLSEAFKEADIVMALRIQKERIEEKIDFDTYIKNYQININNLPYSALLMHPGPINKGIEVDEKVLNTQNAKLILNQAHNGVWVRMAVLDILLSGLGV